MKLSVIVAVHNESLNIPPFYERARRVLDSLSGLKAWEVVFVNDASEDDSLAEILKLRAADPRVKVITLSRRFGYHSVLVAGLSKVESDLYAMVDVDCEDPPELLAKFYEAIQGGADVAYGVRSNREEPSLITFMRKVFYYANKWIADSEIVVWMAEFAMITRHPDAPHDVPVSARRDRIRRV
jgi:glycosyltransferase involved in cell wall biosynthesis